MKRLIIHALLDREETKNRLIVAYARSLNSGNWGSIKNTRQVFNRIQNGHKVRGSRLPQAWKLAMNDPRTEMEIKLWMNLEYFEGFLNYH